MGFWKNVEKECKYRGISRKELASAAHFSVNTISTGLKRSGMPAADLALRISKVLGVSLESLLCGSDAMVSEQDISDIHQKQELISHYLPVIERLENMPADAAKAILTIINNIRL
ncbi:MAG: helix-turn-helix domain-containing protein [Treponema sp.]|jgi:transcriptional regulator with XRE-family HTH domain|nr:helix-turn-helix domain-containing protein [Treponema sp.]